MCICSPDGMARMNNGSHWFYRRMQGPVFGWWQWCDTQVGLEYMDIERLWLIDCVGLLGIYRSIYLFSALKYHQVNRSIGWSAIAYPDHIKQWSRERWVSLLYDLSDGEFRPQNLRRTQLAYPCCPAIKSIQSWYLLSALAPYSLPICFPGLDVGVRAPCDTAMRYQSEGRKGGRGGVRRKSWRWKPAFLLIFVIWRLSHSNGCFSRHACHEDGNADKSIQKKLTLWEKPTTNPT